VLPLGKNANPQSDHECLLTPMVFRHQVHHQCSAYVRSMVYFHERGERFHSDEYARLEIAMLEQASSLQTKAVKIAACNHGARLIRSANR